MRDTGNQAKYEQLLDKAGFEIRNDDKEHNENASLDEVSLAADRNNSAVPIGSSLCT
jgi:hypothetical protein